MTTAISQKMGKEIPGPTPVPLLGWLPWLLQFAFDPLSSLEKMRNQYGDILRLGIKNYPVPEGFNGELRP